MIKTISKIISILLICITKICSSQCLSINNNNVILNASIINTDSFLVNIQNNTSQRIWINTDFEFSFYYDNSINHDSLVKYVVLNISDQKIPDDYKTRYKNYFLIRPIEAKSSFYYKLKIPTTNPYSITDSLNRIQLFFSYISTNKIKRRMILRNDTRN